MMLRSHSVVGLEGMPVTRDHYDWVITEDADAYDQETGRLVFRFRKNAIPSSVVWRAASIFEDIDRRMPPSYSRHTAAGKLCVERAKRIRSDVVAVHPDGADPYIGQLELEDGRVLRKPRCNPVGSYKAGYNFDRFRRIGIATGFSRRFPNDWKGAIPFFEAIGEAFEDLMPEESDRMRRWCRSEGISPDFTIGNTCLSTVAINVNYDSCFHLDRGDMKEGYSTLTALGVGGNYDGGFLVLPGYRVAIDVRDGDLLSNQSHVDLHGNTEVRASFGAKRISFVTYLKGTLNQARNRSAVR